MEGLSVFHKYKVKIDYKGSAYISTDWEGDSKYEDYSFTEEKLISGGELAEIFAEELKDNEFFDLAITDHKWRFGFFNQNNGSYCDKDYTILGEVDERNND